jgi:hypothetical protein
VAKITFYYDVVYHCQKLINSKQQKGRFVTKQTPNHKIGELDKAQRTYVVYF